MITGKLIILASHNILRWVILGLGIKLYTGWFRKESWTNRTKKAGMFFTIALDTQLLLGLLLYFIFSDLTKTAFRDLGEAMLNPTLRFFSVEHFFLMITAITIAHIANSFGNKNIEEPEKFKRTAILFTLSFLFVILGIPWTSRPLLPGF